MTRCDQCNQEFHGADSCGWPYLEIEGVLYAREGEYDFGKSFVQTTNLEGLRCDDCGVLLGKIHHYGCTMEKCPKCGELLATCSCDNVYPKHERKQETQ